MKIFSTADWHIDNNTEFFKSLEFFVSKVESEKPDLITIAGDLFDKAHLNAGSAGFVKVIKHFTRMLNICPIAAIYGTPSHDVAGSLAVLENLKALYKFTILEPGRWLTCWNGIQITGIPEINKVFYLTDKENSSNSEINESLSKFVFGLSSTRKDHLPSLVLYHGEIVGAKLNENQVLPAGGVALSDMDLLSIGADYYSCGHIHMRQNITPKIKYEGSIYPKNWGERTVKAFTVINVIGKDMSLDEVVFPTQPMEKIKGNLLDADIAKEHLPDNTKLWLDLQYSQEDFKNLDQETKDAQLKYLVTMGYSSDSRITYSIIKNETTRAIEIVETKSLFDKVMIWQKNTNSENLSSKSIDNIRNSCQDYEDKLKSSGFSHEPRSLVLKSLSLRGAIGVWKGTGKESIEINFSDINNGIVALLGDNGSGKSTIIKNCNPYPDPIDGGIGLKNIFFLKDSHSITVWEDMHNNKTYKCIKKINAETKSGKTEFFLMTYNDNKEWTPYNEDQNGRKEPYKKAILDIFGSDEIFKRSVYIAQKGSSLPETVSERKVLFNELLGNQYLESIHEMVKEDFKKFVNKEEIITGKLSVLDGNSINVTQIKELIQSFENKMIDEAVTIENLKKDQFSMNKRCEFYKENKEELEKLKTEKQLISKDEVFTENIINTKKKVIEEQNKLVSSKEELVKAIDKQSSILLKIKKIENNLVISEKKYEKTREDYYISVDKHHEFIKLHNDSINKLEMMIKRKNNAINDIESQIKSINNRIKLLDKPCVKCGYVPLETQKDIDLLNNKKQKLIDDSEMCSSELENSKIELKNMHKENLPEEPSNDKLVESRNVCDWSKREIEKLSSEKMSNNNYNDMLLKLKSIEKADEIMLLSKQEIQKQTGFLKEFKETLKSLETKIEHLQKVCLAYSDYESKLNTLKHEISKHEKEYAVLNNSVKNAQEKIEENKKTLDLIATMKQKIAEIQHIKVTLNLLKSATGKDGIQALELDALAPAILETANKLLTRIYGEKFSLSVETIRETSKGEQVEDFEIVVTDNEEQNINIKTQKLSTLSGGEEVWILKAIYDAFAVVGDNNTGLKYLTTFQDEADGALSPEKKHLYLRMIEASHEESGRIHTIYVTHDEAIQTLIKERITL